MKILTCAATLLLASLSIAQDSLKTVQLEEVAVTAIRASALAPASQLRIDRKEIETVDLGQDASIALEKLSPSIISFSDAGTNFGNYNQIRLRGIDQTRINMTLNGVPLNDMVDQGVFFSNFTDFSSSIESLQVQRGVGVSTNGTSSYAGAISYQSINLNREQASGNFNFTGGSFGTLRFNAAASTGRMENDLAAYARVSRITSNGYKDHSGSNAQSAFFSVGKFFDKSVLKVTAFAGKTQNDQAYLPVLLTDIQDDPRTNYFSPNDVDDFEQELIQVQYSKELINNSLFWNTTAYYGGSRGFFPFFDSFFNSQTIYALQNDHYGILSNLDYVGDHYRISGGMHGYLFDRVNETATAPQVSDPFYQDETDKDELSAFAKIAYDINKFSVFADLQVRSVHMTFDSDSLLAYTNDQTASRNELFINPKIGLTYNFSNQSNTYVSFGRTGREPTRTDLLQGDFNSAISAFNFNAFSDEDVIKSEYVNDLEIGYRYESNDYSVSINAFWMDFENEISIVGGLAQNSYVSLRQNVSSSTRSGLELTLKGKANEWLSYGLQGTYMQTNVESFDTGVEIVEDVEHAFAPDIMIAPSLIVKPIEALSIAIDTRYVSESFMELGNDPDFTLPSFFVANTTLRWMINDQIEFGAQINNLFDEQYFTDGAPVDLDFDGTPEGPGYRIQPPRNFLGSLKVRF